MTSKVLFAAAALLVAGCASRPAPEPIIRTIEVPVPVPQPCPGRETAGPRKVYPDTPEAIQSAPNIFERVKLLLLAREQRIARENVLEDIVDVCSR